MSMEKIKVKIDTDYIKLDQLLKFLSLTSSGAEAKMIILDGEVKVNGEICFVRGKKIYTGDKIEVFSNLYEVE